MLISKTIPNTWLADATISLKVSLHCLAQPLKRLEITSLDYSHVKFTTSVQSDIILNGTQRKVLFFILAVRQNE